MRKCTSRSKVTLNHRLIIWRFPMVENNTGVIPVSSDYKVYFTCFKSLGSVVVKTYKADFSKLTAANMYLSKYQLYQTKDLVGLDTYLHSMNAYETITLGVTAQNNGICRTAKEIREGKDGIYRGKEHVRYFNDVYGSIPNCYSFFFMDIDYDSSMPEHFELSSPQEVYTTLVKLVPEFQGVSMLIRPSSSANIYNSISGEQRSTAPSWHVYVIVANSTAVTNADFEEYIKRRAWREDINLAYVKEDGAGVKEKYYLDLAVISSERVIIEAQPILEYPLMKTIVPSTIFKGGILDLSQIKLDLEPDYREKLATHRSLLRGKPTASVKQRTMIIGALTTPNQQTKTIHISHAAKEQILSMVAYLQQNKFTKYDQIKKFMDDEVIASILKFLGYSVSHDYKFKMRDEKTASASIRYDGYIKDFGSTFSGSIIDFIMHVYDLTFVDSWKYIQKCFGKRLNLSKAVQTVLPTPNNYETSLMPPKYEPIL